MSEFCHKLFSEKNRAWVHVQNLWSQSVRKCPYWQPNPDPAERIATSVLHSVKSILCSTLCKLSTQIRAAHPQVDALTRWVVSDDWIDKYISKSVCYSPDWHAPTHTLQGEDSSAQLTARKTDNLQLVFSSNAPCAHLHSQTHRKTHADISAITCQSALPLSYKHRLFRRSWRLHAKFQARKVTSRKHSLKATESVPFTCDLGWTCQVYICC